MQARWVTIKSMYLTLVHVSNEICKCVSLSELNMSGFVCQVYVYLSKIKYCWKSSIFTFYFHKSVKTIGWVWSNRLLYHKESITMTFIAEWTDVLSSNNITNSLAIIHSVILPLFSVDFVCNTISISNCVCTYNYPLKFCY